MNIICFHQSADLYGSDRSFLQVMEYLVNCGKYTRIVVVLPRKGPLVFKLNELGIEVRFMEMSLLSKTYLKSFQWGKILFPLFCIGKKKKMIEEFDVWYVNTSVILDFYVLAPFLKRKKILHIREIPTKWLSKLLSFLIRRSGATVLFNSHSTENSFDSFKDSMVIHNAFEGFPYEPPAPVMVSNSSPLKILLIGRLNSWKGQDFAIEALAKLTDKNFRLRIVGSPSAGNESLADQLKAKAVSLGMGSYTDFIEFIADPSEEYRNTDVLIVPSIKPEPFGRIAIEAMSVGKPVIASNHGGLPEIVEHDRNGFLFEPGDTDSFNSYIHRYIQDRMLVRKHGEASRASFLTNFSTDKMHRRLDDVFIL